MSGQFILQTNIRIHICLFCIFLPRASYFTFAREEYKLIHQKSFKRLLCKVCCECATKILFTYLLSFNKHFVSKSYAHYFHFYLLKILSFQGQNDKVR